MTVDTHILDCDQCRSIYEAALRHRAQFVPASLEGIIAIGGEEYCRRYNEMPALAVTVADYEHICARQGIPKAGDVRLVAAGSA